MAKPENKPKVAAKKTSEKVSDKADKVSPDKMAEKKSSGSGKSEAGQPVFQLLGCYVKDLSFECPRPSFAIGGGADAQFTLDIGLKTGKVGDFLHEICLTLTASAVSPDKKPVYIAEVEACGVFRAEKISDADLVPLLAIEGAALVYPTARHTLVSVVVDGSFPPPMLGPVDFRSIFQQSRQAPVGSVN